MNGLYRVGLSIAVVAVICVTASFGCSESETRPATRTAAPAPAPVESVESVEPEPAAQPPKIVPKEPAGDDDATLLSRGRAVYSANCIACHNPNPAMDGGIGPSVAGSSLELIEARVMRNSYPEGYTPKRDTRAMIALPYLEKDLAAIVAFLAQSQ